MKNQLTAFRNIIILTVFILSSVSIIGQIHSGLADTNSTDQSLLPTINLVEGTQTTNTLQNMIADFNANFSLHYGFKVQSLFCCGTTDMYDTYIGNFKTHSTLYDVISMDVTWPAEFAQAGYIQPLNDVFNASYQSQFIQAAVAAGTYSGSIYSVPWFHDSAMLYYRTDILHYANANGIINDPNSSPPTTWVQLENWSVAMMGNSALIRKFNLTSGFVWQGKSYEGLMCDFMEYLGATGTYTFLSSQNVSTIFKTSSGLRDALKYMKSLITSGASPQSVLNYDEEGSRAVWNGGNAIFMRNWPYAYYLSLHSPYLNGSLVSGSDHNVQQFNVSAMPAENSSVVNPRTSCLGGWQLGVSSYSIHPTDAKKFIMWLTAAKQQTTYFLGNGYYPTLKTLYNSPSIINSNQSYVHTFLPIFESSISRPISPIYQQVSSALVPTINRYIAGKISLESAITTMSSSVKSVSNKALGINSSNNSFTYIAITLVIGVVIACIAVVVYYSRYKKRGLSKQGKKLTEQDSGTYTNISKSICTVCGSKLNSNELFCPNCGSRI